MGMGAILLWLLEVLAGVTMLCALAETGALFLQAAAGAGHVLLTQLLPATLLFALHLAPALALLPCLQGLASTAAGLRRAL
ncbi:hypothetical protein Y1Q_0017160 [Alligator mississippiensis]|uniref:Uncharacterized protein n=1 Tax=Alligator mississippiensis TaxID=8496 RepID=A0A151NZT2_ALLMI|nr:hypothetical protein Y1Q_0017160 [Alligator mississippiensis]